ncbi:MAG: NrfD/PsrC family molybdoenzyme membrane anchor subunit [Chthoniobacterales bacterium]
MSVPNEQRLDRIREEAAARGVVSGNGVDVAGGPIPRKVGYYGQPVVKPPVWTWEIPVYFFIGGLAGMSAVVAAGAAVFHQHEIMRTAMRLAAAGAILSPILLILDLGRPLLFINMLRVFKPQSAMSMGAWILSFFGGCVFPGLIGLEVHHAHLLGSTLDEFVRIVAAAMIAGSAVFGMLLATYTGVLIGATAIPAWFLHRTLLPIHFGVAGLGSAAAALELFGHHTAAINALGFFAAGIETVLMIWLTADRHGAADRACHHGFSGWLIRSGELLTGPIPLISRGVGLIPVAAVSFLLGALISRFGWLAAGTASGCDPEAVFASQRM